MSREKVYKGFLKYQDSIVAIKEEVAVQKSLDSGAYTCKYDPRMDQLSFVPMHLKHDQIVCIPNTAQNAIAREIDYFLSPECQNRFAEVGLLPKNNILLYGKPGTGKTVLVNRIAHKVMSLGGIVVFNPEPRALTHISNALIDSSPDKFCLLILEEIDSYIKHNEHDLLHFLDGETQSDRAIFIATTNFIEQIPNRLLRPGRFSVVREIGMPDFDARLFYLKTKFSHLNNCLDLSTTIANNTDGFTIDQLKEVVRLFYCMKVPISDAIDRVKDSADNKTVKKSYSYDNSEDYLDDPHISLADMFSDD